MLFAISNRNMKDEHGDYIGENDPKYPPHPKAKFLPFQRLDQRTVENPSQIYMITEEQWFSKGKFHCKIDVPDQWKNQYSDRKNWIQRSIDSNHWFVDIQSCYDLAIFVEKYSYKIVEFSENNTYMHIILE